MAVQLSQAQRLAALMRQHEKHLRHLVSVQRRAIAIVLAAGDTTLAEDTLDTLEGATATALTVMQDALLAARAASDSGLTTSEGECN
jgi:hypothetical protein